MKPYYEQDGITIYHGDCREILPTLGRFDLLLTDPPYGIDYAADFKKWNGAPSEWQKVHGDRNPFDPSLLLLWDCDKVIAWGANYYSSGLPVGDWLVWDKRCGEHLDRMIGSSLEMAWMTGTGKVHVKRLLHGGVVNADSISGNNEKRWHPTQKPVPLLSWCLKHAGDVSCVVDPFLGSGTTLVAAKLAGIEATGIEINERYCEIAANRLRQGVFQFEEPGQ